MSDQNNVSLTGRLAHAPELRTIRTGTSVVQVNLATETGYGEHKKTNFINLTFWGKKAEALAKYCVKGEYIWVQGEIIQDSWEDQETGKTVSKTGVKAFNWGFTPGGKPKGSPAPEPAAPATSVDSLPEEDGDEIPF